MPTKGGRSLAVSGFRLLLTCSFFEARQEGGAFGKKATYAAFHAFIAHKSLLVAGLQRT